MSKQPNPWTFRPPEEWKPEIAASMEKRGLKRHAWLRWAIRKVLDAEKASAVDYQPSGTAKPIKFVGESGPELTKLPKPQSVKPLERETVTPRFKKGGK